jgi:multidrug efflux pump subunit AcrB
VGKGERKAQSHDIAKRLRPALKKIGDRYGARIKVAEIPPGPPVLSTLVAEIYGPDAKRRIEIAKDIKQVFKDTDGVVDVDWYVEEDQPKISFAVDQSFILQHKITTNRRRENINDHRLILSSHFPANHRKGPQRKARLGA